jgi:hypothetical protein
MYFVLPVVTFPKKVLDLWLRHDGLSLSVPVFCLLFLTQVAIPTKAQTRAYVANQCSNDISVHRYRDQHRGRDHSGWGSFAAIGTKANLAGTTNPVKVTLAIGNDTGSASVQALFL